MDILVTYDIADTESTGASRLRRIADVSEKYGQRVQFSVFECRLSKAKLARLVGKVEDGRLFAVLPALRFACGYATGFRLPGRDQVFVVGSGIHGAAE